MANPDWGTKRMCLSCGAKFYDFKHSPITCPSCGARFKDQDFNKPRRGSPGNAKAVAAAVKPPEPANKKNVADAEPAADDAISKDSDKEVDGDLPVAAEAGLINDVEDEDSEDDDSLNSVLDSNVDENVEAELNSEIDTTSQKEVES